jgi:hypothetical protein
MTTPGMQGEVSPESMRETGLQPSKARPTRNRPLPQLLGDTAEQSRLKPCRGKPFELPNELELESQKGNPGLDGPEQGSGVVGMMELGGSWAISSQSRRKIRTFALQGTLAY